MLSSASLDRSLHLLIEVVTHKQIARKQAPFMRTIEQEAARFFRKQGIAVGRAYAVTQLQEAAIDDVLAGADIGKLAAAIARSYVGGMAFAGAEYALGINFTLKNPRAVAYQKDRGVELLKELNKTTKNDINELIINGLEHGLSPQVIERSIRSLFVSYAATKRGKRSRAQLVAITETARAYSAGNYGAILDASGTGLAFEKSWLIADSNADPHCTSNADQGWIDFGAQHSSGAIHPPDHPNCRCVERYRRKTDTTIAPSQTAKKFELADKKTYSTLNDTLGTFWPNSTSNWNEEIVFEDGRLAAGTYYVEDGHITLNSRLLKLGDVKYEHTMFATIIHEMLHGRSLGAYDYKENGLGWEEAIVEANTQLNIINIADALGYKYANANALMERTNRTYRKRWINPLDAVLDTLELDKTTYYKTMLSKNCATRRQYIRDALIVKFGDRLGVEKFDAIDRILK